MRAWWAAASPPAAAHLDAAPRRHEASIPGFAPRSRRERLYANEFALWVVLSVRTRYVSNVFSSLTPPSSPQAGLVPVLPAHASHLMQHDRKDLPVLG